MSYFINSINSNTTPLMTPTKQHSSNDLFLNYNPVPAFSPNIKSPSILCQKRIFDNFNEDEDDQLIKKLKNSSTGNVIMTPQKPQLGARQTHFDFSSVIDVTKIFAKNSLDLSETTNLKFRASNNSASGSDATTMNSEAASEAKSEAIIIEDHESSNEVYEQPLIEINEEDSIGEPEVELIDSDEEPGVEAKVEINKGCEVVVEDKVDYEAVFGQMYENLVVGFQRQLEFLKVMKQMNGPEYVNCWPMLDKLNPIIAGVMKEKAKIDRNTLTVMKRTHKLVRLDIQKQNMAKMAPGTGSSTPQDDLLMDNTREVMSFILEGVKGCNGN